MTDAPQETPAGTPEAAIRRLEEALKDPDLARDVQGIRQHLGSFTFDPVGSPED